MCFILLIIFFIGGFFMKNLNFLKLALVFAMATQSAGLLAMETQPSTKIEEPKKEETQKGTSFKESLFNAAKLSGEFLKKHNTVVSSTLVGGATLGLGFLGGSLYTAATIKSKLIKPEPKSFFTATKLVIGTGVIAGLYYLWTKRADMKTAATNFWNKEDKMTSVKDFCKKWFVEKPKSAYTTSKNWFANLSIFKKTEEVKTDKVKTEEVKTEEVKTEDKKDKVTA
jgi:hypothetical protein